MKSKNLRITGLVLLTTMLSLAGYAQKAESPYKVGDTAPSFVGKDQFGESFDLGAALSKGPVVLMFYRGYWCPYCNKQLSQLEDSLNFITDRGGMVVAVTPEQPEGIKKTIKKTSASFKIIHDKDMAIMNAYQVGFELDQATLKRYSRLGMTNGSNGPNLPVPATYIIDTDGKILYAFYDPDYKKRATVGRILENL